MDTKQLSVTDIPTIPGELFAKFQTSFYSDPSNAAFKALGWSRFERRKGMNGCPFP